MKNKRRPFVPGVKTTKAMRGEEIVVVPKLEGAYNNINLSYTFIEIIIKYNIISQYQVFHHHPSP